MSSVWVFVSNEGTLPSGVFSEENQAKDWINKHSLSGLLAEYPLDTGVYEWALDNGHFQVKYPSHSEPKFIGRFTSAYLNHGHFENGEEMA